MSETIDAIIGIEINQVEDIQAVTVDLPTANGQTQPYQLQIPQLVSWEIEERFRWPSNMVLVISCGVIATPGPQKEALFGLTSLINGTQGRADALRKSVLNGLESHCIAASNIMSLEVRTV